MQDKIAEDDVQTHGATFVPVVLGSNKTTVSVGTGDNEYYPLYASVGLVHNSARRAHHNAVSIIGFLAIPKGLLTSGFFTRMLSPLHTLLQLHMNIRILKNFENSAANSSTHQSIIYSPRFSPTCRHPALHDVPMATSAGVYMDHLSIVLAKAKAVFTAKKPPQLRHARTEQPRSREAAPLIEADEEEVI